MSQKELFLKDVVERVGAKVGKEPTTEKVEQYTKHGHLFLFFEIISLRQELERLKSEMRRRER